MKCPYCKSEDSCEHLLLTVDMTFREATDGALYKWFNSTWSDILEEHEDDNDFLEAEPFDELVETVDGVADASRYGEFEGGPGNSSELQAFYCSSLDRVEAAVKQLSTS